MNTTAHLRSQPTEYDGRGTMMERSSAGARSNEQTDILLLGGSDVLARLRLQIQRIGPYFRAAVVRGEEGTGKSSWARALHRAATGEKGSFVTCSLADLERAAQSGVDGWRRLQPLVDAALGGSLYFERIADGSTTAQALVVELLERLERERRERGGGGRGEVRVIASSREELRVLSAIGRFRQDLLQKLSLVELAVPSLRERKEDLPMLAGEFAARFAGMAGGATPVLDAAALERLKRHAWPGNVRELEEVMRLGMLRCVGSVLREGDLPELRASSTVGCVEEKPARIAPLQDVVNEHVRRVMRECAGNKLRAAEVLGVSRSTLYRMLEVVVGQGA